MRRVRSPGIVLRHMRGTATRNTADLGAGAVVATPEVAAATQTHIPQLRVVHIAETGHNIRRDQFDRYMDVVRGFLAALAGGQNRVEGSAKAPSTEPSMPAR